MNESFPNPLSPQEQKERAKKVYIELAEALINNLEQIPFPGIDPEAYAELKASEDGYCTPIDEKIERFKMKALRWCSESLKKVAMFFYCLSQVITLKKTACFRSTL